MSHQGPRPRETEEKRHYIRCANCGTLMVGMNKAELSAGLGMIGHVRITDKVAMVIQDNLETFETWLYKNRDRFKDKQVEITVQIKEESLS